MWVIVRNPYIQDDLLENRDRRELLIGALHHRLAQIEARADNNPLTLQLVKRTRAAVAEFEAGFPHQEQLRRAVRHRLRASRTTTISISAGWRASRMSPTPLTGVWNFRWSSSLRITRPRCVTWSRPASNLDSPLSRAAAAPATPAAPCALSGHCGHQHRKARCTRWHRTAQARRRRRGRAHGTHRRAGVITLQVTKLAESQG